MRIKELTNQLPKWYRHITLSEDTSEDDGYGSRIGQLLERIRRKTKIVVSLLERIDNVQKGTRRMKTNKVHK
jgi:hypothetical protein